MTQTTTRPIPATTPEACAKYRATQYACTCPDATTRKGGSYLIPGKGRHCKHSAYMVAQAEAAYAARKHSNVISQADRAERAIANLFHPEPARMAPMPALVDDGLSNFFGYRVSMPAPAAQPLAGPCRVPADDFDCFELV